MPEEILKSDLMLRMFKHYWHEAELEPLLEEDQEDDQFSFQHQNNKDLILARM
jgi:hypothetical protein